MRTTDPGDRSAMEGFVEEVLRAWGRLDVVANLIGGYASSDATSGDLAAYRAYWDQKVATIVTATTACLRPMRARGYGRVVSVGSMAALKGEKGAAGYAMANAALLRWTESLAEETKREGVTANCVLPRIIDNAENRAAMPKADPSRWATAAENRGRPCVSFHGGSERDNWHSDTGDRANLRREWALSGFFGQHPLRREPLHPPAA